MTVDPPALRRADWNPARRHSLTRPERAAEEIASLAAVRQPGERLGTKDELRVRCAVSVGTFNEALRMLQSRGVVRVKPGPGGGLFVGTPSPMVRLGNSMLSLDQDAESVADAMRLRDAVDPLLIEDALKYATKKHIKAMRAELSRMHAAADTLDGTAFVHANWALHARIADASPSPIARSFYSSLLDLIESHLLSVIPTDTPTLPGFLQARFELHADLVDAIAQGDRRALDLIAEHNTTAMTPPPAG